MNYEIRGIDPYQKFAIEDYITGDNRVLFNWLKTCRVISFFNITVLIQANDVFDYPFNVKVRNNKAQEYIFMPRFARFMNDHADTQVHYGRDQLGQFMFDLEKQIQEVE